MKKMGWTWHDLMQTPYEEYLKIKRIIRLEEKEKAKEGDQMRDEIEDVTA